jgi:serine/threonine protein kinase
LVKLYEVYEENEYVHLVMEFCAGKTLKQIIDHGNDDSDCSNAEADDFSQNPFALFD